MSPMETAQPIAAARAADDRAAVAVRRAARRPDPGLLLPALSLAKRELVRFLRQRHRVIGALATPIVFWLLIGGGMGRSFRATGLPDGENYLAVLLPRHVLMILLFTAIFSTISIIEDRREGFLQSVLVAPGAADGDRAGQGARRDGAGLRAGAAVPAARARSSASARRPRVCCWRWG